MAITSPARSLGTHVSTARRLRSLASSLSPPYSIGRATPTTPTDRASQPRTGARDGVGMVGDQDDRIGGRDTVAAGYFDAAIVETNRLVEEGPREAIQPAP